MEPSTSWKVHGLVGHGPPGYAARRPHGCCMGEPRLVLWWCGFRGAGCQWCLAGELCERERGHTNTGADAPTAIPHRRQDGRQVKTSERQGENLSVVRIGQKGKNHEGQPCLCHPRTSGSTGKLLTEIVTLIHARAYALTLRCAPRAGRGGTRHWPRPGLSPNPSSLSCRNRCTHL
jgi:hypothetical protein